MTVRNLRQCPSADMGVQGDGWAGDLQVGNGVFRDSENFVSG